VSRIIELGRHVAGEAHVIRINEALSCLIPEPTSEEQAALLASVEERGIYEPLVAAEIMGVLTLLDGHNRLGLADEFGFPYSVRVEERVTTIAEAERWMLEHQLCRRNLNVAQRAKLALALEPHFAADARKRMEAGVSNPRQNSAQGSDDRKSAAKAAAAFGVSRDTVAKIKAIEAEADKDTKAAVQRGEVSVHAAHRASTAAGRAAEDRRAKRKRKPKPEPVDAEYEDVPDELPGSDPFDGQTGGLLDAERRELEEAKRLEKAKQDAARSDADKVRRLAYELGALAGSTLADEDVQAGLLEIVARCEVQLNAFADSLDGGAA
jgi:hypothetical protein